MVDQDSINNQIVDTDLMLWRLYQGEFASNKPRNTEHEAFLWARIDALEALVG